MQLDIFGQGSGEDSVTDVALHETARTRYLNYALSVITARALPDVRDGLKPVQRRILYAMLHSLHLVPEGRYRKSAAVVGDVMAKFHPHGDSAIYEAMVRMAQDFSLRYPLVDGQGNFGSLDGDPPAAMRYTEAKLRTLAMSLLEELKRDTVAFKPTYDGTTVEPVVLPAQVPNLLINGVTGIAVGMATNIPPHHLGEVINALVALIDEPELNTAELAAYVRGPDFPTGGILLNSPEELIQIYENGEGPVRVRGEYFTETNGKVQQVVITSIPYAVVKSSLVTEIAEHIMQGKLPLLTDVRDESTETVRVVCELKKGADPDLAMAYLFKHTSLQSTFHVNMTVLTPTSNPEIGTPLRLSLKEILKYFLKFRFEVLVRRLEHELKELLARIHILEGFEKIFDALDEAIAIIRASDDKPDAAVNLRDRFDLSEIQADTILEMRLHRLAKLEILAIRQELLEKRTRAAAIRALLASDVDLWKTVRAELLAIAAAHPDPRRTKVSTRPQSLPTFNPDAYIVEEDCVLIITRDGWIKRQKSYTGVASVRVREGDEVGWLFETSTRKTVTFFSQLGGAYTLRVDEVPATTGYGEPIQRHFQLGDGEKMVGVIVHDPRLLPAPVEENTPPRGVQTPADGGVELAPPDEPEEETEDEASEALPPGPRALALTRAGRCLRIVLQAHAEPSTRAGRRYARLDKKVKDDGVVAVVVAAGDEHVCIVSEQSRALVFPVAQVKVLRGAGQGVTAIKLPKEDRVKTFCVTRDPKRGIKVTTSRGREVIVAPHTYRSGARGGKGSQIIQVGNITVDPPGVEIVARPKVDEN